MKPIILFLKLLIVVCTTNSTSQSLVKCEGRQSYWVIPDGDSYYAIRLNGDTDLSVQPEILNVNEKALQYILLDKEQYVIKSKENNDQNILLRYTDREKIRLYDKFRVRSLDIYSEIITFHSGKTAVFWHFKLPEGKNKQVTAQLFADIIIGDRIFGLGTPLFAGEDFDGAKVFLLETIDTVSTVKDPDSLCHK